MYKYDAETGFVHDENGNFKADIGYDLSPDMLKLQMKWVEGVAPEDSKKLSRLIRIQEVKELPYIISNPDYCYAYVLYKLRKLSGLTIEDMAIKIGLPKSTYSKIENRFSTVNINTLHIAMLSFGINPIEFADLYWHVQGLVEINGLFSITHDKSVEIMNRIYEECTPINLYDEKSDNKNLEILNMKFHETILIGKKRLLEIAEKQKEI